MGSWHGKHGSHKISNGNELNWPYKCVERKDSKVSSNIPWIAVGNDGQITPMTLDFKWEQTDMQNIDNQSGFSLIFNLWAFNKA